MHWFSRFNPLRAVRDLRRYLAGRKRHEIYFLFGSAAITWTVMWAFVIDSKSIKVPYKRDIIYVQSWPADRSTKEIVAQQKVDQVKRNEAQAELDRRLKERQAKFKKIDDALRRWGL